MDINIKSLSAEQRTDLLEQLQDYKEPKKSFRAERDGNYWFVVSYDSVIIDSEDGHNDDDYRHLIGNYFETEAEAKAHLERQKAIGRVTHRIYELNDGWIPDWSDIEQRKYNIYLDSVCGLLYIRTATWSMGIVSIPYMKTEEITDQIIKECEEDLKLIFNV